jgi:hypothetical protein
MANDNSLDRLRQATAALRASAQGGSQAGILVADDDEQDEPLDQLRQATAKLKGSSQPGTSSATVGKVATPDVVANYVKSQGVSVGAARRYFRDQGYELRDYLPGETAGQQPPTAVATEPEEDTETAAAPSGSPLDRLRAATASLKASVAQDNHVPGSESVVPFTAAIPRTSPTQAAANLGRTVLRLAPPTMDTSEIPLNVFTGGPQGPGPATAEESAKSGTIGPSPDVTISGPHGIPVRVKQDQLSRVGDVFLPGLNPDATLQGSEPIIDPKRGLVAPQNLMTEGEQHQHSIFTGLGQLGEGLTTPENLAILAGTAGFSELPAAARSALSTYFAAQMAEGATDYGVQGWKAYKRGDNEEAQRLWTLAAGSAVLGGAAGAHAIRESPFAPKVGPEPVVPRGTISEPLARDAAAAGAVPENAIGPKGEPLAPESAATLRAQTDALSKGTNRVVYFPKGTENIPAPPENAKVTVVPGEQAGAGTWYHTDEVKPLLILTKVKDGTFGQLLGNHQSKAEALASEAPVAVVARDSDGTEVKGSLVDSAKPEIVAAQVATLQRQFPGAKISIEKPEDVIHERLGTKPKAAENASPASEVQPSEVQQGFAPHAEEFKSLAEQTKRVDPALSEGLKQLTAGKYKTVGDLRQFIADSITDPTAAADLNQILDEHGTASSAPAELRPVIERHGADFRVVADRVRRLDPGLADGLNDLADGKLHHPADLQKFVNENVHEPKAKADLTKIVADYAAATAGQSSTGVAVSRSATGVPRTAPGKPAASEFSPELLEEAKHEIRAASNVASSFERPGRYFAEYGDQHEHMPSRSTNAAKGIHAGGTWYGVGSSRESVAQLYPWFGKMKGGAGKLSELVAKEKGAEYDRLVNTVAEHIQREKDSAAPVVAEFAPKLKSLSDEIDGDDPELSELLAQVAVADGRGFKNLRQYLQEKVAHGEQTRDFFKSVDAAAAEARQAGTEEPADQARELRESESDRTETAEAATGEGTSAGSDFFTSRKLEQKAPTERQTALPGFESPLEELKRATERVRGEKLTEEANRPLGDIENAAGEMERNSPLFRGTAASPQGELLDELGDSNGGGFTGTRYSGVSPAALKKLLPERVREKLDTEVEANQRARGLQGQLYDLESKNAADLVRARKVLKEAPGTAADMEAIYHHLEDPAVKLTSGQQEILDNYLRPLIEKNERINEKLEGGQVENYVHRIPVGKGGLLDRVVGGESELSAGRGLSKSSASLKSRTMMAFEDEAGTRRVVAIKDGDVTAFDRGKPENLGRIRGLETQGVKSMGEVLDRQLEPMRRELDKLETERRTLTATKGREASAARRIENIDARAAELRDALQDAYRTDAGHLLSEDDLRGRVFVDRNGKQWKITQATTKKIEANTGVRYYKNALASTVLNYLNLRKAERAHDFLESYKRSPEFQEVAAKIDSRRVPAGWRPTELSQFHGYAFEPHTAEVLDWYAKRMRAEGPSLYRQIGNFLRTAIFFNPLIHTPNIGVHWIVEKGLTGVGPQNWGRILRTGSRAIDAVIHQNNDFLSALDEGAPLQSARLDNGATTKLLLERMARELEGNPTAAQKVARVLGYVNPAKLVRAIYNFSGRVTWVSNDVAMLQATYEHMEKTGSTFKEAISDVSKHIPDYRLPTRIFNSTALAKLMSNPELTMFGAYHYGALRSYGEMAKSLFSEDMPQAERMKSLDRIAMLGLFTFVAYPALDQLAKYLTGDKTAQFRRAGASTFIYNLAQLAHGEKSPTQVLESVATPAVHTKALLQLAANRDFFTGRQIVDWNADAKTIGKQLARYGGQNLAPVNTGMQVAEGRRTFGQQVAALAGIKTKVPTPAEALARKFAAESAGTAAPDQDTLERSYLRKQYENDLRDRKITPRDLGKALAAGKITEQDAKTILQRAVLTPLQNEFKALPIEKALQVWQKADGQERQTLRALLLAKVERLDMDKYNPAQLKDLIGRLRSALTGSLPTGPPSRPRTMIPLAPPKGTTGRIPFGAPVGTASGKTGIPRTAPVPSFSQ